MRKIVEKKRHCGKNKYCAKDIDVKKMGDGVVMQY